MQYIALPCAPMTISMIIISFQVKSFNDGILLVGPVMSSTCALCTSGTRHLLLIIPPCYAITFFNICFCIILNTYFLTDCLTALYFIILLLFYPDMCPSFFTLLLAYHKPGEGRVLSRTHIRDSYP